VNKVQKFSQVKVEYKFIYFSENDWLFELLQKTALNIHEDPDESLLEAFKSILTEIHLKLKNDFSLVQGPAVAYCQVLSFFCQSEYLAEVFSFALNLK
jgi:hypothetical protein